MATQKEEAARLQTIATTLGKVAKESDQLLVEIVKLKEAVANQENASSELTASVNAVEALAKSIDERVPDVAV